MTGLIIAAIVAAPCLLVALFVVGVVIGSTRNTQRYGGRR
jgi:hypothetical protein